MVRIIKIGSKHKKMYELTCNNCETVFEIEENEAYSDSTCRENDLLIECPVCTCRLYFCKREN